MTLFEYITENREVIRNLFNTGVVAPSVMNNYRIYKHYKELRELGESKSAGIAIVGKTYKKSQRGVYKVLSQMEQPA